MNLRNQNDGIRLDALDELRFSEEAKARLVQSILDAPQTDTPPVQRKARRPLGAVLLAAAICAALAATAAAAVSWSRRQAQVYFVDSVEEVKEILDSQQEPEDSISPTAVGVAGGYGGRDYMLTTAEQEAEWWDAYGSSTPIEEATGTPQDGWTRMRIYQHADSDGFGGTYLGSRYLGEKLSDFNSLWEGTPLDFTWLEEHYTSAPYGNMCYIATGVEGRNVNGGQRIHWGISGEYLGENGIMFEVNCHWFRGAKYSGYFQMTTGYDYTGYYQTVDGVTVTIEMGTSQSGQSRFWAKMESGEYSFSISGAQMGLEELQELLDHLNLSVLLQPDK